MATPTFSMMMKRTESHAPGAGVTRALEPKAEKAFDQHPARFPVDPDPGSDGIEKPELAFHPESQIISGITGAANPRNGDPRTRKPGAGLREDFEEGHTAPRPEPLREGEQTQGR